MFLFSFLDENTEWLDYDDKIFEVRLKCYRDSQLHQSLNELKSQFVFFFM